MATQPLPPGQPRYAQVALTLKDEIARGIHPVGEMLPTEFDLSARFAVSRHTVRAALRLLREERIVSSRQGQGTQVAVPPGVEPFRLEANSIDDLVAYSARMYTEIRDSGIERVEGRTAARLGVAAGQDWLVVRGTSFTKRRQTPVCGSEHYINHRFSALRQVLPRISGPLFLHIEDVFGIRIAEMDQTISTSTLAGPLADRLGAKAGETAIEVRRTYRSGDGALVQVSIHTHPASRFQQTIRMRRLKVE